MKRLTEKLNEYDYKLIKYNDIARANARMKLGKIEDLMEKYEIDSIEALEEIIKYYDHMAKSIVEMELGVKVEIKGKSE
jgi:hypothetical protein